MNRTISLYLAMLTAGVAGYLVLWISVRTLDPLNYANFAAFWSAVYFLVGSLAGFQQEVTRASVPKSVTSPALKKEYIGTSSRLAIYAAFGILLAGLVCAFVVTTLGFPQALSEAIIPATIALSSYVIVAIIAGSLYGIGQWFLLALMISVDALLRLLFVVLSLGGSENLQNLYWSVSIPFGLTILFLSPLLKRKLGGKVVTDVSLKVLGLNSLQAVTAGLGMSLIISGFPLLLAVTSQGTAAESLSQCMFIVTLARAPFVIVAVSLQSLFLVKFKEQGLTSRLLKRLLIGFILLGVVTIALGWAVGRQLLEILVGAPAQLSSFLLIAVVISGLLVALLVISGVSVLAQSQHLRYSFGWALAALTTIGFLVSPIGFEERVILALIVSPILGILVHLSGLRYTNTH